MTYHTLLLVLSGEQHGATSAGCAARLPRSAEKGDNVKLLILGSTALAIGLALLVTQPAHGGVQVGVLEAIRGGDIVANKQCLTQPSYKCSTIIDLGLNCVTQTRCASADPCGTIAATGCRDGACDQDGPTTTRVCRNAASQECTVDAWSLCGTYIQKLNCTYQGLDTLEECGLPKTIWKCTKTGCSGTSTSASCDVANCP